MQSETVHGSADDQWYVGMETKEPYGPPPKRRRKKKKKTSVLRHARRERAEQKRLRRQVQKERRGAMRELRKDAAFLGAARDADVARAKTERRATAHGNLAFMEAQEADFRSGGQVGAAISHDFYVRGHLCHGCDGHAHLACSALKRSLLGSSLRAGYHGICLWL
jgi:hypothetical protein